MPIQPSNVAIVKAAMALSRVGELTRSRGDGMKYKEPANFPGLCMVAAGHIEGTVPESDVINRAIVLAFMLGMSAEE